MKKIPSPLSYSFNTRIIKTFISEEINSKYEKYLGIDVSDILNDGEIFLLEDLENGYKFFYPNSDSYKSNFYNELKKVDWYYQKDKWEYHKAIERISRTDYVLEIGCGKGVFLFKLLRKQVNCKGLEIDRNLVDEQLIKNGIVSVEKLEEFAKIHKEKFTVICLFQVLEHVYSIKKFLDLVIMLLAEGGQLIVAVPNDDSYLKYLDNNVLNLPPHHMGRWNKKSLQSLENYFPLAVDSVALEPLQAINYNSYINSLIERFNIRIIRKLFYISIIRRFILCVLRIIKTRIPGHTILITYRKRIK